MQKLKQYWLVITLGLIVLGLAFYWYGYRPYKARKDCAWTRMHEDATPAKPAGPTQEQINAANACKQKNDSAGTGSFWDTFGCPDASYTPPQPAQPAKDWWARTPDTDYKSCLRGKGF